MTAGSSAFALALYLAFSAVISDESTLVYVVLGMNIVSVMPFLTGRYRMTLARRDDEVPNKKVLLPFYATRALLGACQGVVSFLCMGLAIDTVRRSVPMSVSAIVLVLMIAWFQREPKKRGLPLLRFAPLTACGFIACPFLFLEDTGVYLYLCAPAFVWICWIILHMVQLSAIKGNSGLDDAFLAFTEKIAFMGSATLVVAVLWAFDSLGLTFAVGEGQTVSVILVAVFVAMFVSLYQLTSAIDAKEGDRIVGNAMELSDRRFEPVFEQISERYKLTAREKDVMSLLARNMTISGISEKLYISEGTVRTHLWHIYQKMDIHSRDELLDIVDREIRDRVAK